MMRKTTLLCVVTPIMAVLVAAGCGGSSKTGAASPAGYGYAAPPASSGGATGAAGGAAKVGAASSNLGRIVVNGTTRTLYVFEKDHHGRSACYGACASYWPPLLSKGKPVAASGTQQSLLGTTRRTDGAQQVTYAGHPVYEYAGDTKPGQTTGEGLTDFGAPWDAISPAGMTIQPSNS
jgi:predicted lipoprotein with Yx(FWY)xxD motif